MLPSALRTAYRRFVPAALDQRLRRWVFRKKNAGFQSYTDSFSRYGKNYKFFVGDIVGEAWFRDGWDWTEVDYIHDHLIREGDIVLECGAHHGEITLLFGDWVGESGSVVAIDPLPLNSHIISELDFGLLVTRAGAS